MANYKSCVILKRTKNIVLKSSNLFAYILSKLQITISKLPGQSPFLEGLYIIFFSFNIA